MGHRVRDLTSRIAGAAAALALAACSSGGSDGTAPKAPSPTPSATTIVDGAPCPPSPQPLELPADAGCASATTGSFEPGESRQTFSAYARLDDARLPVQWHLRVTRSEAPPLDAEVHIGSEVSYPVVLGAEDADRDGLDEVFVKVVTHLYHSGGTHEVGIFGLEDGSFFQVDEGGRPRIFQVGGVSTFGEGAECRDVDADGIPEFLLLRVEGVTNETQNWSERTYRWKDRSLVFVKREAGVFAKTGYADPLLFRFYSLRCFSFDPPFPYARG